MKRYFAIYANRKMLTILMMGFSSGLPLLLTNATLQAWLTVEKVDVKSIGEFALIGMPYALKFLWAPFLDSITLPILGRRRGWMVVTQTGLFFSTVLLAFLNPTHSLLTFALAAMLVAFFSASQDIAVDAYRIEIIDDESEYGAAAGVSISGYRGATVISGGVALAMADHYSWKIVYLSMACINLLGLVTVLLSPEPKVKTATKRFDMKAMVVSPFLEFFQRSGAMEILLFIMIYKISTLMATALTTNFLSNQLKYSLTMIGAAYKGAGLIATIAGTLTGGSLMLKFGLKRSLWIFGIIQGISGLTFCGLSMVASPEGVMGAVWLVTFISMDNFMMGMGVAALSGFMMNFCSKQYTGAQFALLSSVMAVSRVILIAHAGSLVNWLGWNTFFICTVPLAIPGLLLLLRYDHWQASAGLATTKKIPRLDLVVIAAFVLSLIALSSDPIWRATGHDDWGVTATLAGAVGIIVVVLFNLVRPHLGMIAKPVRHGV